MVARPSLAGVPTSDYATAAHFERLLEDIYGKIEALDAVAYQGDDSDGWAQARGDDFRDVPKHLCCGIFLDRILSYQNTAVVYQASVIFVHRMNLDDLSEAQSRLHAATRHLAETLLSWSYPSGERITAPVTAEVEIIVPEWAAVTLTCQFHTLRG